MTSILIANTPSERARMEVKFVERDETIQFVYGYHSKEDYNQQAESILSALFTSLLTHEVIYVTSSTLGYIVYSIGVTDTLNLLENNILKVCFGLENFVIKLNDQGHSLSPLQFEWANIEGFEKRVLNNKTSKSKEFEKMMQFIDNSAVYLNRDISKITEKEMESDFSNEVLRSKLGFDSSSMNNVNPAEFYRIIRIANVAQELVLQNKLGANSIYQDGFSKTYINSKLGAFSSIPGNDAILTFSNIMDMKGLPDIYRLYSKNMISIEDILKCRQTFSGGVFRKWYASENYNEKEIVRSLINNKNKEKNITKFIRFIYPNVAGLLSPVMGAAASAVDSYIVSRLLDGWKPSLFLDDVLKNNIDDKIRVFETREKREQFIKRFGSIERNEPCPCQSGKKFKKCHGI